MNRELTVDFPYEQLDSWDVAIKGQDKAVEDCLDFNSRLRNWVHSGKPFSQNERARMYVVSWMLWPKFYESRTETAMAAGIGVSKKVFCSQVSAFRDTFGNLNGLVKKDAARRVCSALRKQQWRQRRQPTHRRKLDLAKRGQAEKPVSSRRYFEARPEPAVATPPPGKESLS
ncbi:MAG: hypothetical protein JWM68_2506 [Verrucomicrobiales bacterium]|nr:hypothetical protein [Verrucomicrobiales bacterium]